MFYNEKVKKIKKLRKEGKEMEILKKSFNQILGRGKIESLIKKIAFVYWCIGMISAALSAVGMILLSLTFLIHGLLGQFILCIIGGAISAGMTVIATILVCLVLCASSEVLKLLTEIRNSVANAEGGSKVADSNDLPSL